MEFLSAAEIAEIWDVSERSVRNYCAQSRVPGAFLTGKTWNIPADAEKPARSNAKRQADSPLLSRLREEKASGTKGGIYHKIQVELAYNSNRIEGSRLSLDQTRLIFETATIGASDGPVRVDDILETQNHFRAVDYVIDHAQQPLSEGMVKELHRTLKAGTTDSAKDWLAVGDYKCLPNEVAGRKTTQPEDVDREVSALLKEYDSRKKALLFRHPGLPRGLRAHSPLPGRQRPCGQARHVQGVPRQPRGPVRHRRRHEGLLLSGALGMGLRAGVPYGYLPGRAGSVQGDARLLPKPIRPRVIYRDEDAFLLTLIYVFH